MVITEQKLDQLREILGGAPKKMALLSHTNPDGDTIGARGTTLGGDDAIAVAMALAILAADDIPHPPLEVVITVDEETGMLGAAALDASVLKGRTMLNLDSEDEGVLTVSCAGGNVSVCTLPVTRAPFSGTALTVTVGGLLGGHSGAEIDKGRGNANLLMGRVLYAVGARTPLRLVSVAGGLKDNAIPRESRAVIAVADAAAAQAAICREVSLPLVLGSPSILWPVLSMEAASWQLICPVSAAITLCTGESAAAIATIFACVAPGTNFIMASSLAISFFMPASALPHHWSSP